MIDDRPLIEDARRLGSRAVFEAKMAVAPSPRLAVGISRLRRHGELVDRKTDILIEGYPRSANSFAVAAFRLAQPRPVSIAHHTHAAGHIVQAVHLRIPSIVVIREPEECVLEFAMLRPRITVRQALRAWIRFYLAVAPYRARFVIAPFPRVVSDYGAVIARVNELFGTSFAEFDHTDENVREVFRQMDEYWRRRLGDGASIEPYVNRPSGVRERAKEELRPSYAAIPRRVRTRAGTLYERFASAAR